MKTTTEIAVISIRVSGEEQAEHGTSLETQEIDCLRHAERSGYKVHAVYRDEGVSGARYATRAGIQAALAAIENGSANVLLMARLDRLGRDVDILRDIRKRVGKAGGRLEFTDGLNFENTAVGGLMFDQMSSYAEYYRDDLKEKAVKGRKRRAEQGIQPCRSRVPFGYLLPSTHDVIAGRAEASQIGKYHIHEPQAVWIREIFEKYANGASLRGIGRWLELQGVAAPSGGTVWNASTLRVIIQNSTYKGEATYGRKFTENDESRAERGFKILYKSVLADPSTWTIIPCPAIVSAETWEACQQRLAENNERKSGNPKRRYMLSSLVRCPLCGNKCYGQTIRQYHYYQCYHYSNPQLHIKKIDAKMFVTPRAPLESLVIKTLIGMSKYPDQVKAALSSYEAERRKSAHRSDAPTIRTRLNEQLEALNKRERETVNAQIAGIQAGASADAFNHVYGEIAKQRQSIKEQIDRLPVEMEADDLPRLLTAAEALASVIADLEEALTSPEIEDWEKHEMISEVIDAIYPSKDGGETTIVFRDKKTVHSNPS